VRRREQALLQLREVLRPGSEGLFADRFVTGEPGSGVRVDRAQIESVTYPQQVRAKPTLEASERTRRRGASRATVTINP
jgi:hypothetical protein